MAKAIVELSDWARTQAELRELGRRLDAGEELPEADYRLGFANAAQLFSKLTPKRLALLDALKRIGPVSIYALAKHLERNYSNVHADIGKLLEHGLVEKTPEGKVWVPWEEIQIRVTLGGEEAA